MIARRAVLPLLAAPAMAQPRPVRLVVPYAPGGTTDLAARALAPAMSDALGQVIVVENRPGASGIIGMEAVMRAAPDGTTLVMAADTAIYQPLLRPQPPYDARRDFAPVGIVVVQPLVMAAHPGLGVTSLAELIALARQRVEPLHLAVSGLGGSHHLAGALLADMAGFRISPVAYRGGGPATLDLVAGTVPLAMLGSGPVVPHAREGRVRMLAVTSARRSASLPDVPAAAETPGLENLAIEQWFGMLAPRATAPATIARLQVAMAGALSQPPLRRALAELAVDAVGGTPEEFAQRIEAEARIWIDAARRLGITEG